MDEKPSEQEGTEPTEGEMLAAAMKADAGELPEVESEAKPSTESPTVEPAKEVKPVETQEKPKVEESAKEPETKLEDESKYSKARKEQERQDRSWKKLEEEKAALRAEKEAIEAAKKEVETVKVKVKAFRDEHGYTAEDYDSFAKNAEDVDLAERARNKAVELRKKEEETKANSSRDEFVAEWNKSLAEVLEEHPDLKDETSDMGKELKKVLAERKVFSFAPDGIKHAVEFVKLQRQSGLVSGLETENATLKKEIERLNKLTGISGSGPTQRPSSKSFDDMTSTEQAAHLKRQAEEFDKGG